MTNNYQDSSNKPSTKNYMNSLNDDNNGNNDYCLNLQETKGTKSSLRKKFKKYMTNQKNIVNTSINNHNKTNKNIKNLPNKEEKNNSGNINIKKLNIIDSDNELYFSESIRINNIKTKQFQRLSKNPFSMKLIKNRLTLNKNSTKIITTLKKNYIDSENKLLILEVLFLMGIISGKYIINLVKLKIKLIN